MRLARHYVVPHISTGDMFRAAVQSGTDFGRRLQEYMESGELVPDDVTIGVVAARLEQDDTTTRGFILDGFPRNAHQAEELSKILIPRDIDLALDLEVDTEVVLRRLAARRVFVPHPIQDRTDDEMRALADAAVDEILDALRGS